MTKPKQPPNPAFEQAVRESFARQGLMGTIGAWLVEVTPGQVVIEVPLSPRLTQQHGLFHGGVVGAVGDTAGGYAALSLMPAGADVTTVEYKINLLRGADGPLLRAIGAVIRPGRTLTVVRVDCASGAPGALQPCALIQATMMRIK
jgi:uncharacterized protein (TIGR00369 family)